MSDTRREAIIRAILDCHAKRLGVTTSPTRRAVVAAKAERYRPRAIEEADAILAALDAMHGPPLSHHKRGGRYIVVAPMAQVQASEPLTDYEVVTVYRAADGTVWVRRKAEFEDGRFISRDPEGDTEPSAPPNPDDYCPWCKSHHPEGTGCGRLISGGQSD